MADCPTNSEGVVIEGDCTLQPGNTLRFYATDAPESLPDEPPTPPDPPGESLPEEAAPPPPPPLRRTAMPDVTPTAPEAASDAPVEDAAPQVEAPVAASDTTTATTEVPSGPSGIDADGMSKLAGAANGDSTMLIVLGVIGLAGAGTTWKFLTQWSEQRHEQKMKQLDISERASGLGAASPPPCQAAHAKLEAELADTKARLAAVEKKSMSLSADFDGEDLERQVKKLTKTVKAMQEGTH